MITQIATGRVLLFPELTITYSKLWGIAHWGPTYLQELWWQLNCATFFLWLDIVQFERESRISAKEVQELRKTVLQAMREALNFRPTFAIITGNCRPTQSDVQGWIPAVTRHHTMLGMGLGVLTCADTLQPFEHLHVQKVLLGMRAVLGTKSRTSHIQGSTTEPYLLSLPSVWLG